MVQHLKKSHGGGYHRCHTEDGAQFEVTSSHHQMSILGVDGVYLGWSEKDLCLEDCVYDGDLSKQSLVSCDERGQTGRFHVTEAFAYPDRKVFATQHHPEWQKIEEEAPQWTLAKIREICFGEEEQEIKTA